MFQRRFAGVAPQWMGILWFVVIGISVCQADLIIGSSRTVTFDADPPLTSVMAPTTLGGPVGLEPDPGDVFPTEMVTLFGNGLGNTGEYCILANDPDDGSAPSVPFLSPTITFQTNGSLTLAPMEYVEVSYEFDQSLETLTNEEYTIGYTVEFVPLDFSGSESGSHTDTSMSIDESFSGSFQVPATPSAFPASSSFFVRLTATATRTSLGSNKTMTAFCVTLPEITLEVMAIPEPSSSVLLGLVGMLAIVRRRWRMRCSLYR